MSSLTNLTTDISVARLGQPDGFCPLGPDNRVPAIHAPLVGTTSNALSPLPGNEYYVRTDGDDANDGLANTAGQAFASIDRFVIELRSYRLDVEDTVTLWLEAGTYIVDRPFLLPYVKVVIRSVSGNPADVTIQKTGTPADPVNFPGIFIEAQASLTIQDVTIVAPQLDVPEAAAFAVFLTNCEIDTRLISLAGNTEVVVEDCNFLGVLGEASESAWLMLRSRSNLTWGTGNSFDVGAAMLAGKYFATCFNYSRIVFNDVFTFIPNGEEFLNLISQSNAYIRSGTTGDIRTVGLSRYTVNDTGTETFISYDNTTSGLVAVNYQDAIDEIVSNIEGSSTVLITDDVEWYMDATSGSDTNDGLSPGTAWQTLQKLTDELSKLVPDQWLKHAVIVEFADGIYNTGNSSSRPMVFNLPRGIFVEFIGNNSDVTAVQITGGIQFTGAGRTSSDLFISDISVFTRARVESTILTLNTCRLATSVPSVSAENAIIYITDCVRNGNTSTTLFNIEDSRLFLIGAFTALTAADIDNFVRAFGTSHIELTTGFNLVGSWALPMTFDLRGGSTISGVDIAGDLKGATVNYFKNNDSVQLGDGTNNTASTLQFLTTPLANATGLITSHTAVNYTAADSNIDTHIAGIDAALAAGGGEDYFASNFIGTLPVASGTDALSIGRDTTAAGSGSIVIGYNNNNSASNSDSVLIGSNIVNTGGSGDRVVGLGQGVQVNGLYSVGIGQNANANSTATISIGFNSDATAADSIAIGRVAQALGTSSIAIGDGADADTIEAIAIGENAQATNSQSVALGADASSSAIGAIQLGQGTNLTATTLQFRTNRIADSNGLYGGALAAYDDDAAAGVGGLTAGQMYQTTGSGAAPLNVAGIVMVKQ